MAVEIQVSIEDPQEVWDKLYELVEQNPEKFKPVLHRTLGERRKDQEKRGNKLQAMLFGP